MWEKSEGLFCVRGKEMKPDAIICADLHIRPTSPICRTDDFMEAQRYKFETIANFQYTFRCPVLCSGDVTNSWNSNPAGISLGLRYLMGLDLVAVPGNHDLPAHSIKRLEESAYWALVCGEVITDLSEGEAYAGKKFEVHGFPYGMPLQKTSGSRWQVALVHHYVYKGRKPFPGQLKRVTEIMDQLEGYRLIVTGDNHIPFVHYHNGQCLVNPGSLTRQKANETHRPRIYFWYAESNEVEAYYFETDPSDVSRKHRQEQKDRDSRIERFVKRLGDSLIKTIENEHLFENKMKQAIAQAKLTELAEEKIWEAMDHEQEK